MKFFSSLHNFLNQHAMSKKLLLALFLVTGLHYFSAAQTGISAAGTAPDAAAMLDVIATDKGFMLPRVALTALNAAGPVTGLSGTSTSLIVYNTATAGTAPNDVTPGFYYWNNATTSWIRILSGSGNAIAGNDIDFGTSATGSIDVEPILNFVHTVSAPASNNLNLNAASGFAAVINANNGTTGATQSFRVGNGAGGADVFYVQANGTFYSANQAQITSHAIIGGNLGVTGTSSQTGAATFGTSVTISPFTTAGIVTNTSAGLLGTTVPGTSGYLLSSSNTGTITWVDPATFTPKWNAITAPDGALTLSHGTNATVFNFANTTTTGFAINGTAQTTGTLFNVASTNAAQTGNTMLVNANATAAPANGIVRFNFTGVRTAAGTGFQIDDASTTLATTMRINSNALTTGTAMAISSNGITGGKALDITSASVGFTGTLAHATLSGSNAANTGTVLKATNSGVLNTGTALMVTNLGAATSTSFRVNDETGDTDATPFIITSNGNVGIGIAAPFATLTNAGSTAFGTLALTNFAANAPIGTAAATVDIYTAININQTTASITLTLPSPTTATAGRIIKISNVGSAAFTVGGVTVGATQATEFFWNGTAWVAEVGGSSPSLTVPISGLLPAIATNTINNANFAQTWNWNTMAAGSALTLGSTSTVGTASSNSTILNLTRSGANANATHTAYGIQSAVTNTGTTSTNVAGYFSASGATNNYALVVPSTGGNVGVGIVTPTAKMSISSNGTELGGTSMSATFKTHAGTLGAVATNEIAAGSIGFTANTNRVALGVRGYRVSAGSDWTTSAILLGMDVDATPRAGGYISIGANGVIGIGVVPTSNTYKLNVQGGKLLTAGIDENSDARLKKDINPIYDALTKVTQMRGVTYNWRTEEFPERNFEKDMQFGLIAQELEKVIPELVTTDGDGYKAIEYSHLVPVLIEAIKELDAKNNEQKVQLDNQTKTNEELKASMENLLIRMNAVENNVENKTNKAEK